MAEPIWRDYFVDLGAPAAGAPGVPFYIYSVAASAIVFQGVSYPRPGESTAKARINDICADYLAHYFMEQENAARPSRATFKVYSTASGSPVEKASVEFFNDWSYDPDYDPAADGLNAPIVLTFAPLQFIPVSLYSGSIGTARIWTDNGMVYGYPPVKYRGADFNNDYNDDFLIAWEYYGDSYVIPLMDFPGAVRVEYGGRVWTPSKACPQFVLYYVNAHGGWDALPVEGRTVQADAVTRHTAGVEYDNRRTETRGKRNYVNELKHTFEFWTGLLNERQAAMMHHLLNSPAVYVHDMESGHISPLVLTGSTTEYKNGAPGLYSYKIEAELARDRVRR